MTTPAERTVELVGIMLEVSEELGIRFDEMTWSDFKEGLNDQDYDVKQLQRAFAARGGFVRVRNAHLSPVLTANAKEKIELSKKASKSTKVIKALAEELDQVQTFESAIKNVFGNGLPAVKAFKPRKIVGKGRPAEANILLSDMHFGTDLKSAEGFMQYGFVEEARCMASIVSRVCEYKPSHREHTDLNVYLGGDLIRGKIHEREYSMPMALQTADALWLLVQSIRVWAANFKKVTVRCVTGNHDRSPDTHPGKAVGGRFDSEASKIYYALKLALAQQENVEVVIPMTQYHSFEIFGERVYLGHGDINLNPGNPGSKISTRSLESQINNLNVGAVSRGEKPFRLFMVGHVHVGSLIHLSMGDLITNGTLQPSDAFATSIGYYSAARGQVMFESVPGHIVGDYRFLSVNEATHKDSSLDRIIKPFSGEF